MPGSNTPRKKKQGQICETKSPTFHNYVQRLWDYTLSILIICAFCVCKFAHSLKFVTPNQYFWHFQVICGHMQEKERFESLDAPVPGRGDVLPGFSFHNVSKYLFHYLFSAKCITFLYLWLISLSIYLPSCFVLK